jgi:hypothetical protein
MKEIADARKRANWTGLGEPLVAEVDGMQPNNWVDALNKLNQAQFLLMLLPGNKGKDDKNL